MGLAQQIFAHDTRAASRLLSWIEDGDPRAAGELREIFPRTGSAYLLGITGAPGAGKSTLTDLLISLYRSRGLIVGVLAVDQSSPFTGGAVLGDRIRMQRHATDAGVFIRSMASRSWPGGLSRSATEAVRVLEAWGCGLVIIETVGVGQNEVEVSRLACTTVLVCAPGAGDRIQAIKAGVTEIADIVALNKADLADVEHAARALEMTLALHPRGGWRPPLVRTIARDGRGMEELAGAIDAHRRFIEGNGTLAEKKMEGLKDHLKEIIRRKLHERISGHLPSDGELRSRVAEIQKGLADPYTVADEIAAKEITP